MTDSATVDHGHGHEHHHHGHDPLLTRMLRTFRPHSHDHSERIDAALATSREGTRALKLSLGGLVVTAAIQAVVVVLTGSVGLLADTIHNFADALTAVPLGLAFIVSRRPATDKYTYGFGRSEDLAGLAVVGVIAFSVLAAAWEAISRIAHPHNVTHLWAVGAAGAVGFLGNEIVARFRIRVGQRIGSAALVADGRHARADGLASLAVTVGAGGQAAGWRLADAVVGLAISAVISLTLWRAGREILGRLMDSADANTVSSIRALALSTPGVESVGRVRVRWIGHQLQGEMDLGVSATITVQAAHDIAEAVEDNLLAGIPRLGGITIHTDPTPATG